MSENLRRAESLFNRIMNPNKPQGSSEPSSGRPYHKSANQNHRYTGNDSDLGRSNHRHTNNYSNGYTRYSSRSYKNYNHSQHSTLPTTSFDLPKRDPAKEAQDAVLALAPNLLVLPYCWTIWYHSRTKSKAASVSKDAPSTPPHGAKSGAAAVDSYLQDLAEIEFPCFGDPQKTVKPIASLEQMWISMSSLKRTYELSNGSEFLIFKTGVNPVWEDPINARGGRWVFRFSHRVNPNLTNQESQETVQKGRRRAALTWERLVLKTLSGSILLGRNEHYDALLSDIVGLALSVRRNEETISIWNSNLHFSKKQEEDEEKGTLTGFHARRVYCDAVLRLIREVDAIMQGSDTQLSSSDERISGVTFEYRLHSDNAYPCNINSNNNNHNTSNNGCNLANTEHPRRGKNYHHHHQREERDEEIQA